jgi:hypothetical protein
MPPDCRGPKHQKMVLLLSKRGKGFGIHFIYYIQFPLSVYFPETCNPWLFSQEKCLGFVINLFIVLFFLYNTHLERSAADNKKIQYSK